MEEGNAVSVARGGSQQLLLRWFLLSIFLGGCAAAGSPESPTEQAVTVPPIPASTMTVPAQVVAESPEPSVVYSPTVAPLATTPSAADTLTPSAAPTTQVPPPATTGAPAGGCVIQATRTPRPDASTRIVPDLTLTPGAAATLQYVDPHIEICANAYTVSVGQLVTIVGYPVDLGLPYYTLLYQTDPNAGPPAWILEVTYDNQVKRLVEGTDPLEFVSVAASNSWVEIVLRAVRPGMAGYFITATGEIHYGYPGPATWGGGGSDTIAITVK